MNKYTKPTVEGEWKLLFRPEKFGKYINDHDIIQAPDKSWHLHGITSLADGDYSENERYFVHASTSSLDVPMKEIKKVCDDGVRAWAPGVIFHDERYYIMMRKNGSSRDPISAYLQVARN